MLLDTGTRTALRSAAEPRWSKVGNLIRCERSDGK